MDAPINFESSREKEKYREQLRTAREHALEKAKFQYDKQQQRKAEAEKRGEGTWMLPALSNKIDQQQQDLEKLKKKKAKKEKKEKKKKSKHKRISSKASNSDQDTGSEPEWVESCQTSTATKEPLPKGPTIKGPRFERDDWMIGDDFSGLGSITSKQYKEDRRKEREAENESRKTEISEPGQHKMELNPFWKDGGSGLPEEAPKLKTPKQQAVSPSIAAGDGGVGWWRKAYQRCVEQANDEGRTLEDVAADRYGSLEKLEKLLHDAEKGQNRSKGNERGCNTYDKHYDKHRSSKSYNRPSDTWSSKSASKFMKPKDIDSDEDNSSNHYQSHEKSRSSQRGWKKQGFMKPGKDKLLHSASSRKFLPPKDISDDESTRPSRKSNRSRSRSPQRNQRLKSPRRRHKSRSCSSSPKRKRRSRSRSYSPKYTRRSRSRSYSPKYSRRSRSRSFSPKYSRRSRSRSYSPKYSRRSKPTTSQKSTCKIHESLQLPRKLEEHSHSESSHTEDSSISTSESDTEEENQPSAPVVRILTEAEMNVIGAKILRAELMGDMGQASQLKAQLNASREASKNAPKAPVTTKSNDDDKVVLTRTDRSGNIRPVEGRSVPQEPTQGRRKKQKVKTHSETGSRERYFDDDDKFDLKALVEREKSSTAEDQNMMFARLAGRSMEKTDEEHQIDDVIVSRASKEQSQSKIEDRDRQMAVIEHKKMNEAMEKCTYCFGKVSKHLIISIGNKVYLCLPQHRSMVDGHCLIVPMQHVAQGTAVDEDVWEEMQTFRKMLTKMFSDKNEDCVFMETSMNLRRHPHLVMECVPMPIEIGDMAPIYFKKAIMEVGPEWAQNKKLVDLSKKDVRHSVPKAFPYFSVDFGLQGGYAHVIEDEKTFQHYFGREIVAGMMDLEPTLWRKPHRENFDQQRNKVLKFEEMWKPYDWTLTINKI